MIYLICRLGTSACFEKCGHSTFSDREEWVRPSSRRTKGAVKWGHSDAGQQEWGDAFQIIHLDPSSPQSSKEGTPDVFPGVAKPSQTTSLEPKQVKRWAWWLPATNAIVARQKCPGDLTLNKDLAGKTGPKRRAIWSWEQTPSHMHYFCCCICHQSYDGNKICNCFPYTLGRFTSSNRQCKC